MFFSFQMLSIYFLSAQKYYKFHISILLMISEFCIKITLTPLCISVIPFTLFMYFNIHIIIWIRFFLISIFYTLPKSLVGIH